MFGLLRHAKFLLVATIFCIGLLILADWTAEYLWFDSLRYESVFLKIRALKVLFFLVTFVGAFAYFWINFRIFASRSDLVAVITALATQLTGRSAGPRTPPISQSLQQYTGGNLRAWTQSLLMVAAAMLALVFGLVFYNRWDTLLRFWRSQPYGEIDPIFGRDIGFYLFELPFLELLQNSLLAASLVALILLILGYRYAGLLPADWRQVLEAPAEVLWHLAGNIALYFVAMAWGQQAVLQQLKKR